MSPGDRWEVEGRRWEGSGKVRCRKENFFSLHSACAIFPAVIFKLHGKKAGFRGAKVQIFGFICPNFGEYYSSKFKIRASLYNQSMDM